MAVRILEDDKLTWIIPLVNTHIETVESYEAYHG
jgi:hypothetical protein